MMPQPQNLNPEFQAGIQHGSAAVVTIIALRPTAAGRPNTVDGQTVDGFQAAPESLGNVQTEYRSSPAMGGRPPTTPPGEPATRRSPFAEFRASPAQPAQDRSASAEPPGVPGRRRRSRSPHAAPSPGTGPGASDGRSTAAIQHLYGQLDAMAKQRAEDVKRLDILEAQLREQAREAKDYVRQKSLDQRLIDLDKEIRTELDKTVPGMLVALERNISDRLDERIKDTESKMAKHATLTAQNIDNLNKVVNSHVQTIERHQEYLKGMVTAKPGEEQTLMGYFKYLEAEILKVNSASRADAAMCQKVLEEAKKS